MAGGSEKVWIFMHLLLPIAVVARGEARQFIKDHLSRAHRVGTPIGTSINEARLKHLWAAYGYVPPRLRVKQPLHLEFGVREGMSINFMANKTAALGHSAVWDGFDSFQGLPKSHVPVGTGWTAGAFSTGGRMPAVRGNVRLHAGWFNDTLPTFLDQHKDRPVAFIHLDADIFESTWTVFENVCSRCMLRSGTVLSFDELFAKNQRKILNHEWR